MSLLSTKTPSITSSIQRLAAVHTEAGPQHKIMNMWLLHFHIGLHNSSPVTQQMQMSSEEPTNQIRDVTN